MKSKYLFVIAILVAPTMAMASDWLTSTFSINATHVDLVALTKTPAFSIIGKAVFRKDFYSGHIVVNATPYKCRSISYGVLVKGGAEQYICNMNANVFLDLIEQQAEKKVSFSEAQSVLIQYFKVHSGVGYTTIPIGFSSAEVEEQISDYSLQYLEPNHHQLEVSLDYSASGVAEF